MKVDAIRRCYGKDLEGKWDWTIYVWFGKGFFCDVILTGRKEFDTEKECQSDMARVIKLMKLNPTHKRLT